MQITKIDITKSQIAVIISSVIVLFLCCYVIPKFYKSHSALGTYSKNFTILKHQPGYSQDPKHLYDGAFDNIRLIWRAQQEYHLANGHYANDIRKLNMDFEDIAVRGEGKYLGSVRLKSGFEYLIDESEDQGHITVLYWNDWSKNDQAEWAIQFYYGGDFYCLARDAKGKQICLAGVDTTKQAHPHLLTYICNKGYDGYKLSSDIILELFLNGKFVNGPNIDLFIGASREGNIGIVRLLLEQNIDVNKISKQYDRTALQEAVHNSHMEIVEILLAAGAKTNGQQLLELAISPQNFSHFMVISNGTSVGELNPTQERILKMLLEAGVSPNEGVCDETKFVPLKSLPKEISEDAYRSFGLSPNDEVNIECTSHPAALFVAIDLNNKEAVKLLLRNGANLNIRNYIGETPLKIATKKGFMDIVSILEQYQRKEE
ncbi:MAG: ankyrin repeat domain-containing protein [Elusimicrobiota bacterium]|jgi:hypothetical protein|nr:ankyrin repeat domain-containing protein [Elusimicrobiota bacterium]